MMKTSETVPCVSCGEMTSPGNGFAMGSDPVEPYCQKCMAHVIASGQAAREDRAVVFAEAFPEGPDYAAIGLRIGKLVAEKNKQYGSAFAQSDQILKILFPDGIQPDRYKNMLAICRIVDKLFRLAADNAPSDSESPGDDIAGYGILISANADEVRRNGA
jgi:hypothetical protein